MGVVNSNEITGLRAAGDPGEEPPKGCLPAVSAILTVFTIVVGVVVKFSVLGPDVLAGTAHCLLVLAALGWLSRAGIRTRIGYFRRPRIEGASAWALPLASLVDATFGLAWVGVAIVLLVRFAGPLATGVATGGVCLASFVLALVTHRLAQTAGRPRASEWVRERCRDWLEAGKTTWPGWLLVKAIDRRSPKELLSTYVSGSMATLLLVIILVVSAAVSERASEAGPEPPSAVATGEAGVTSASAAPPAIAGESVHLLCVPATVTVFPLTPHR
jgi:hypothetical protein